MISISYPFAGKGSGRQNTAVPQPAQIPLLEITCQDTPDPSAGDHMSRHTRSLCWVKSGSLNPSSEEDPPRERPDQDI
jgi:hypothetical protein